MWQKIHFVIQFGKFSIAFCERDRVMIYARDASTVSGVGYLVGIKQYSGILNAPQNDTG